MNENLDGEDQVQMEMERASERFLKDRPAATGRELMEFQKEHFAKLALSNKEKWAQQKREEAQYLRAARGLTPHPMWLRGGKCSPR